MTDLAISSPMELALVQGDLSKLSEAERASYYQQVCQSVGLNPLTKPFQYIVLNKKLTLYATKDAAAQIRKLHGISFTNVERDVDGELGIVTYTVTGKDSKGREDTEIGVVSIGISGNRLKGEALCNAYMKALTKAKRRLALSLGGLGWLDETELETIPQAQSVTAELEPQAQLTAETVDAELVDDEPPAYRTNSAASDYEARLAIALDVTKDFGPDDLIPASDVQLQRVGYGPREGRKLLKQMFHKQSRQQLTESELRIFISELMNLPTKMPEVAEHA